MQEEFYYLGKITKLFGYKGEVIFYLDVDDSSEYENLEMVFIDLGGDLVPFMIESISLVKSNNAIVKLLDINNEDNARRLINASLKLPMSTLPKLQGNKFYFHEVIGFDVWDVNEGRIGVLKEVNDTTAQALFEIRDGFTEYLLPVADEFIVEVNRELKKLIVVFPEGLLDVYRKPEQE